MSTTAVRPRRRWYAVAAGIALLGVVVGVVLLVVRVNAWTDRFPDLGSPFRSGETVPVDLVAGRPVVLYVSPDTASVDLSCTGDVAGSPLTVSRLTYTFTFLSGRRSWAAHSGVVAGRAGPGRLSCTVTGVGAGGVTLAVGEEPDNGRLLGGLAAAIGAGAVPVVLGFVAGGVLAVVVARRRRRAVR